VLKGAEAQHPQFWYREHLHYALLCVSFLCSDHLLVYLQCDSAVGVSEHRLRELEVASMSKHGGEAMSERVPADLLLDPKHFQCRPEMTLEDHVGL
jgi:hypothetical protein